MIFHGTQFSIVKREQEMKLNVLRTHSWSDKMLIVLCYSGVSSLKYQLRRVYFYTHNLHVQY
jgi:hypothetical protein